MSDDNVTTEPSKGWAGLISMLLTLLGLIEAAHPGRFPIVTKAIHEIPYIGQAVPLLVAIGGSIYTAASSAVPQLRALFWWKKTRVVVVPSPTGKL